MEDKKLEKIISLIKEMMNEEGAPTMNVGAGHIAGTREAGDDPPVRLDGRTKRARMFRRYPGIWPMIQKKN